MKVSTSLPLTLFPFLAILFTQGASRKAYYGKLIGDFRSYAHSVSGKVYAVDEDTFLIKDFSYDGKAPGASFWIGTTSQPSPNQVLVPYPDDYSSIEPQNLREFSREDVVLNLPAGHKIKDYRYLAVWSERFTEDFGHVKIPKDIEVPQRKTLPELKRLAHGVRSGNVMILDAKTIYVPNLYYDGAGPDAFFWVGNGTNPNSSGRKVPDEKGTLQVLKGYQGEDIELTLPGDLTVFDIEYFAIYCITYRHNFGHVMIPKNLDVPPYLGKIKNRVAKKTYTYSSCKEFLKDQIQVQWQREEETVYFKVSAKMKEEQYVSIGFSAEVGVTKMVGADAVVIYYMPDSISKFRADDYYLQAQSQCDGKFGACPDDRVGGTNDVTVMSGTRNNGITSVTFQRPVRSHETRDPGRFDVDLNGEFNIFVAMGNLNTRKEVAYHYGDRTEKQEDIRIRLSKTDFTCKLGDGLSNLNVGTETTYKIWETTIIENTQNFSVRIGPTGGVRGYTPITGKPSWGIAYWINDFLIPELYVERGKTYTFYIEAGRDSTNPSRYHPFYITTSEEGGYGQKNSAERGKQRVYAGIEFGSDGYPKETGVGRYCEWEHKTIDKSKVSETQEEFKKTLQLFCEDDGEAGVLTWTVPKDAPDTLYYQCFTHNTLGWKIHVVNPGVRARRTSAKSSRISSSISIVIQSVAILFFIKSILL